MPEWVRVAYEAESALRALCGDEPRAGWAVLPVEARLACAAEMVLRFRMEGAQDG